MSDSVKPRTRAIASAAGAAGVCADRRPRGRPAGRCPTRDDLVQAGIGVFTEHGFAATGIDAVLREVGVPKGSFYHYFSSKEEFGLAVIDAYARHYAEKLARLFGDPTVPPVARFGSVLAGAGRGMRKHAFRRGCLVASLGREFGCTHDVFAKRLAAVFGDWQRQVGDCLREAQAGGQIDPAADANRNQIIDSAGVRPPGGVRPATAAATSPTATSATATTRPAATTSSRPAATSSTPASRPAATSSSSTARPATSTTTQQRTTTQPSRQTTSTPNRQPATQPDRTTTSAPRRTVKPRTPTVRPIEPTEPRRVPRDPQSNP